MAQLRIKYWLKKRDLSLRQFCIRMGIQYKNSYRMFKPTYDPRLSQLEKMAKTLNIKVRDLIED